MPLAYFNQWHYVLCKRIFIDTDERDLSRSPSAFNSYHELEELYEKIVAMELVSWNIPFDVVPTFFTDSSVQPQNNLLDIYLEDIPHTVDLTLTVVLNGTGYSTPEDLGASLVAQIETAMNATYLTQVDWLTSGGVVSTRFHYRVDEYGRLLIYCRRDAVVDSANMQYLFFSGPSNGFTPYEVLGFASASDTDVIAVPGPVTYPLPSFPPLLSVYRCVDVSINEAPEFKPLRRIIMTGSDFDTYNVVRRNYMLMTRPINNLQSLRVRTSLADGSEPALRSTAGIDIVLELLVAAQEQTVPSWVQQVLRV